MSGPAVLALDELLTGLTGEDIETLRAHMLTGFRDQLDAATADAWQRITQGPIEGIGALTPIEHPDWLRLPLLHTVVQWSEGTHRTCMHDPHPDRPRPVVAAAWRPGWLVCARCRYLLALPRHSTATRTCDACGRVVERPDVLTALTIAFGPLSFMAACCRDCEYWDRPEGPR